MYIFSAPDHLYKVDSSSSNVVTGPSDNCFIKNKNAKYTNGSTNNLFFSGNYRIVASSSLSRIEAHVGLFRLLMKGIFDPYVL